MMNGRLVLLSLYLLVGYAHCCLPGPFGFGGYNPMYSTGYYGNPVVNPMIAPGIMNPGIMGPRIGPFRSEQKSENPRIQAQMDEIQNAAALNCPTFAEENQCRWGNTNEEELDWSAVRKTPEIEKWFPYLGVQNNPDPQAGVLVSTARQGWESGRLLSDMLPCVSNGLQLTATVWTTKTENTIDDPKLQVCTRNQGEEKMPLINCNDFPVRNGVPMTIDVPPASEPFTPAQIVLNGYNFMATYGGAIFIQDIVVEGSTQCSGESPTLIDQPAFINDGETNTAYRSNSQPGPLRVMEGLTGMEAPNAPISPQYEEKNNIIENSQEIRPPGIPPVASESANSFIGATPTLFETCLALSCNPSDFSCKFWRSSGPNRWEIGGHNKRQTNPLTGINQPPGTAEKFLVAPFNKPEPMSFILVSESLSIPPTQNVYFCFYEFYATEGSSLSVCTDSMECFYEKTTLSMGSGMETNKQWNIRCSKLPVGTYELRIIAKNNGENQGEVGFLPIRLSRDAEGLDFIC